MNKDRRGAGFVVSFLLVGRVAELGRLAISKLGGGVYSFTAVPETETISIEPP